MFSVVSQATAASVGMTVDSAGVKAAGEAHGIGRNVIDSWVGTFDSFTIGDETIRNANLRIANMNKYNDIATVRSRIPLPGQMPSMLIGADFFLAHRLLIYGIDRKIVFTYLSGQVFDTLHLDQEDADAARSNDRPQTAEPANTPR